VIAEQADAAFDQQNFAVNLNLLARLANPRDAPLRLQKIEEVESKKGCIVY
jgi:hypothetical protein